MRILTALKTPRGAPQIEVFYELNAAAIQSAARGNDDAHDGSSGGDGGASSGAPAGGCVFRTSEERAMLVALLLHCADISNASKPRHIAEKCVPGRRAQGEMHLGFLDSVHA